MSDKPKPAYPMRDSFLPDLHVDTVKVELQHFHYRQQWHGQRTSLVG
jgi:hypothetical protein